MVRSLEQFSKECRKTKANVITLTNQKSKKRQVISIKGGKTRASKSRLVLVLRLIG